MAGVVSTGNGIGQARSIIGVSTAMVVDQTVGILGDVTRGRSTGASFMSRMVMVMVAEQSITIRYTNREGVCVLVSWSMDRSR